MFSVSRRRLADHINQLGESVDRAVPVESVETLVAEHPRPSRLRPILSGVLAYEADRENPGLSRAKQQKLNHACDYLGSGCISQVLGLFFDAYTVGRLERFDIRFVDDYSRELAADGCALVERHVPSADCARIVEFLGQETLVFREDLTGKKHRGYSMRNVEQTTSNVCRLQDQSALLDCPQIAALAFDPCLIEIAQRFLGAPPIHTQVSCWWSTPYSKELEYVKAAAQRFHQDRDYIKFLKIFIYLTDVDDSAGPHEFIAGSNVDYATVSKNRQRSSKRLTDEYLHSVYSSERFRRFAAPRGSIIFEDTSGFHKGQPVASGHRLMLQLEFVSTLFANRPYLFRNTALAKVPAEFVSFDRLVSAYEK